MAPTKKIRGRSQTICASQRPVEFGSTQARNSVTDRTASAVSAIGFYPRQKQCINLLVAIADLDCAQRSCVRPRTRLQTHILRFGERTPRRRTPAPAIRRRRERTALARANPNNDLAPAPTAFCKGHCSGFLRGRKIPGAPPSTVMLIKCDRAISGRCQTGAANHAYQTEHSNRKKRVAQHKLPPVCLYPV